MKLIVKILAVILLLAFGAGASVYFFANDLFATAVRMHLNTREHPLARSIKHRIARPDQTKIVLSELTDFEWDKVVIAGPYTPSESVNEVLGFTWDNYKYYDVSSEEAHVLLFVRKGEITEIVKFDLRLNFSLDAVAVAFTPEQAIFDVENRPMTYVQKVLKPVTP